MTDYWKWAGMEITAWKRRVQQSVDCVQKGCAFLNSIRVWTGNGRKRLRRENGIWYCAKTLTKAISNSRITFFKLVSFRYLKLFFFSIITSLDPPSTLNKSAIYRGMLFGDPNIGKSQKLQGDSFAHKLFSPMFILSC